MTWSKTSPFRCMLQVFFGLGEPGFAAASRALICGSFFDASAGLAFSMAAALVVRSLKDMLFILFGFSAGISGPRSGTNSRVRLIGICILTGPFTMARCGTSRRGMILIGPVCDHLDVIPRSRRGGSRGPWHFRSSFACHEQPWRHLGRSSPA
jgi:hypothetical protein